MTDSPDQPQPLDLDTGERLATTGRAVANAIAHRVRGEHEAEEGHLQQVSAAEAEAIIEAWPEAPRNVARQMLEKYGAPNEATPTRLIWYRNDPWKRTELSSEVVTHNWPTIHSDFLTQVIDYRVPPEMISDIALFDGSVVVDRTRGEVSARCDSEAANVLAMNMVHEIVTGKRTVADARETTEQSTVAYNLGRSAPYAEKLLFEPPQGGTEDLDESQIGEAIVKQAAGKVKDVVTGTKEEATDRLTGPDTP